MGYKVYIYTGEILQMDIGKYPCELLNIVDITLTTGQTILG